MGNGEVNSESVVYRAVQGASWRVGEKSAMPQGVAEWVISKGMRVKAAPCEITPTLARDILERWGQENFRAIDVHKVKQYAADMRRGNWQFTGDPITFSTTGLLTNGRHRLSAIRDSGCSQILMVVWGVQDRVSLVQDTGKGRKVEDYLRHGGVPAAAAASSLARSICAWLQGGDVRGVIHYSPTRRPTNTEIINTYYDRAEAINATVRLWPRSYGTRIPPVLMQFHLWCVSGGLPPTDVPDVIEFVDALKHHDRLSLEHPIAQLMRRVTPSLARSATLTIDRRVVHALVIKAWNAIQTDNWPAQLKWRGLTLAQEAFPTPICADGVVEVADSQFIHRLAESARSERTAMGAGDS